jgi:type I restriction enzyme S subunit
MNAQDLKNSILQLAIQGKLVEQREEEGTAEELIANLLDTKKELLKENKIYKKKPTEPFYYSEELPFDIPESWRWVQLSDISIIQEGAGIRKYQYRDSGIQLFSVTNILDGSIDLEKKQLYVSEEEFKEKYTHLQLNKGDIVTACSGGSWGKVAVYDNEATVMLNTSTLRLRFFEDLGNNDFLYHIVQSAFFKRQLQEQLVGIQPNFGYAHYSRICLPIPPLEEQKRIVAKIEELMPYVEKYNVAYSEVEELNKKFPEDMQKSILQYAIQGKLVEQREEDGTAEELYKQIQEEKKKLIKEGKIKKTKALPEIAEDEIPFDIPENWKWVRLGDVTHNWGQKKPDKTFDYIDVGSIDNINGMLSEEENLINPKDAPSRARKIVKEGSVIYSTVRPYLLNICIINKEFEHEPIASTAFAILHPIKGIYNKYLYFILKSPMFISYVSSVMIGVAYPAINDTNLLAGLIPLPPFEEQKRVVEKIEELIPYAKQLVR